MWERGWRESEPAVGTLCFSVSLSLSLSQSLSSFCLCRLHCTLPTTVLVVPKFVLLPPKNTWPEPERERLTDWLKEQWPQTEISVSSQCVHCWEDSSSVEPVRRRNAQENRVEGEQGRGDCQNRTVHLIHFSLRQSRQRQTSFCSISSRQCCCWWRRPFPADASYFLLPFFKKFMDTLFTG